MSHDGERWRLLTKSLGRVCCRHQSCSFDFYIACLEVAVVQLPGCCGWKLCWFLFLKDEQQACRKTRNLSKTIFFCSTSQYFFSFAWPYAEETSGVT